MIREIIDILKNGLPIYREKKINWNKLSNEVLVKKKYEGRLGELSKQIELSGFTVDEAINSAKALAISPTIGDSEIFSTGLDISKFHGREYVFSCNSVASMEF